MSRVEQFERIRKDHREGLGIRALARKHKVHRRVVRQALSSPIPPPRKAAPRRSSPVLGPYEETIGGWLLADKEAPKKQRHSARRIWQRLVAEEGAELAESTVGAALCRIRAELAEPPEAMVPQVHDPGAEAEVDFGEFYAMVASELTKLWMFGLRLSCSGKACHRSFVTKAQEAFFAGHVDAFERMEAVPHRIRDDNLLRSQLITGH